VTGLYTIATYERTPQDVVDALLHASDRQEPAPCPIPVGKEVRAALEGKAVAMTRLVERVAQRDGPQLQHRVALTDGAEALQQQMVPYFPEHTLVLDIIHGMARVLLGCHADDARHPDITLGIRGGGF
jgi:hypothetical protein